MPKKTKAEKREAKKKKDKMLVSGKTVFKLKEIIEKDAKTNK
jgi:hypothetical protein